MLQPSEPSSASPADPVSGPSPLTLEDRRIMLRCALAALLISTIPTLAFIHYWITRVGFDFPNPDHVLLSACLFFFGGPVVTSALTVGLFFLLFHIFRRKLV